MTDLEPFILDLLEMLVGYIIALFTSLFEIVYYFFQPFWNMFIVIVPILLVGLILLLVFQPLITWLYQHSTHFQRELVTAYAFGFLSYNFCISIGIPLLASIFDNDGHLATVGSVVLAIGNLNTVAGQAFLICCLPLPYLITKAEQNNYVAKEKQLEQDFLKLLAMQEEQLITDPSTIERVKCLYCGGYVEDKQRNYHPECRELILQVKSKEEK